MGIYFLYLISAVVLAAAGAILQKYGKTIAFELGFILSKTVPGKNRKNSSAPDKREGKLKHFAKRLMGKYTFSPSYTKIFLVLMLIADFRSGDAKVVFSFAVALLIVLSLISSEVSLFDFAFLFCGFGALVLSLSEVALYAVSQNRQASADILSVSFTIVFLYCYIPHYVQRAKCIFFPEHTGFSWKSAGTALIDAIPVIASVAEIMDSETVRKVFLS